MFDLADPASAYVFGFMQADGHHRALSGNGGWVRIEIRADDADVLYDMQSVIPWRTSVTFRERSTNVSASHKSATLNLYGLEGRRRLLELGLPTGCKSRSIAPPEEPFSHSDYLRGLFDADGSVGFYANGLPFLSLATTSPAITSFTCAEILRVTGRRRTIKPNRHGMANVLVTKDPAVTFARWLYADACISMRRKREAAMAVSAWTWPVGRYPRSTPRSWTDAEDAVALQDIPEKLAAEMLGRTAASVNKRRWRLRHPEAA